MCLEKDRLLSAKTTTEACLIEKELIFKQKRNAMLLELRKQKEQWDQALANRAVALYSVKVRTKIDLQSQYIRPY